MEKIYMQSKITNYLIKNKEILQQAINLDNSKWENSFGFESLLKIGQDIDEGNYNIESKNNNTYMVLYNGNPSVTLELALMGIITNSNMIFMIYDNMLAVNTIIVKMMEQIIKEEELKNFVKLYNNSKNKDIKRSINFTTKIIYIGDKFGYENAKKDYNIPIIYNGYGSVAVYTDDEEHFIEELTEIQNYAFENDIELDFYDGDLEEEIQFINYDMPADTCVIFSNDEDKIKLFKETLNSRRILVNENPFKEYNFEFDINELL
jgi:gamma-glutamyl phosphate reductase